MRLRKSYGMRIASDVVSGVVTKVSPTDSGPGLK